MNSFVSYQQALQLLQENLFLMPEENMPLLQAIGRYSAKPIIAPIDVPGFDNSAMDGFCFAYDATHRSEQLSVRHIIKAGDTNIPTLSPGEAAQIFTGAPIPIGADTVVMQEKVIKTAEEISFSYADIKQGEHIRKRASQTKKGDSIVAPYSRITPEMVGFLAGFGITDVAVFKQPKVSILCTGNELVDPGKSLQFGQIYNSNAFALQALLQHLSIATHAVQVVSDEAPAVKHAIQALLHQSDVVLITGGISVGDYDFVFDSLQENEVSPIFYKVKQKPGKPLFFGRKGNQFVFAIPGNPAACMTCFHVYIKPFLQQLMGHKNPYHPTFQVPLSHDYIKKGSLTHLLKAKLTDGSMTIMEGQESYKTDAFAIANGIAIVPESMEKIQKGSFLSFIPFQH